MIFYFVTQICEENVIPDSARKKVPSNMNDYTDVAINFDPTAAVKSLQFIF